MEFTIELPKNPITKEEIKSKRKAMFREDFDKGGNLAKIFVFTKLNEPVNSQDLKMILQGYYKTEYDINLIKRGLKKLNELGILNSISSGEIMSMPQNEMNDLLKDVYRKFFIFLDHIPKQFRKQYNQVNYYWVSNGDGEEYIEWCCNILGFKCVKEKPNERS